MTQRRNLLVDLSSENQGVGVALYITATRAQRFRQVWSAQACKALPEQRRRH
jgi:hypothetical protein